MSGPDVQVVEGLIVQPGDTLVIRIDPDRVVNPEGLAVFRASVERTMPPNVALMVVVADQLALMLAPDGGGTDG